MKALTVTPRVPTSAKLREIPQPSVDDVSGGRGVMVRVLRVAVPAAVLLAQASTHLWHGTHEEIGMFLDEALAEVGRYLFAASPARAL